MRGKRDSENTVLKSSISAVGGYADYPMILHAFQSFGIEELVIDSPANTDFAPVGYLTSL